MKRLFTFVLSTTLLGGPALASAQSVFPIGPTPQQLLTRVAQLEAQESTLQNGQSLACAAVFSKATVKIGQTVDLAWGSVGALDPEIVSTTQPMWLPQGGSVLSFTKAGTWTYSFTFYSASNASTTCSAKVIVTK